jgi:hypothetical protein
MSDAREERRQYFDALERQRAADYETMQKIFDVLATHAAILAEIKTSIRVHEESTDAAHRTNEKRFDDLLSQLRNQ